MFVFIKCKFCLCISRYHMYVLIIEIIRQFYLVWENCLQIPREIISSSFYDHYSCMIIPILSTSELISFSVVILCDHGVISVIFWNAINADT